MKKALLMILDGWGIGNKTESDVIYNARTPYMDYLTKTYPNSHLLTSGENVGLPDGQMGNSEVGHLSIGAGRIVYQDLVKINIAIRDNSISENKVLVDAFNYAKKNDKQVHFIGLIGQGGVHAMSHHLLKLCDITNDLGLNRVYIHAITDGRDTDPRSGLGYMKEVLDHIDQTNVKVATLIGRYYTMDRDKRWERVKEGYELMVHGVGEKSIDVLKSIEKSYSDGITDEFIKPVVMVDKKNKPISKIQEGDVVICFNFRTDRLRQITTVLTQKDFPELGMTTMPLYYLTLTRYDDSFKGVKIVYDKDNVKNTIGELLANAGKSQLRIAETEKYAHVTFFFSGGREEIFKNEKRALIPSPKVATYDMQPEMSAFEVRDAVVAELKKNKHDFICLNFANGDMVGHTGVYAAIRNAVEAVDSCVKDVVETAQKNGYTVMIIADHGNADYALNDDGTPNTAHSLNPVPCIIVSDEYKSVKPGVLADVAPTLLEIMGMKPAEEMTGKILVSK